MSESDKFNLLDVEKFKKVSGKFASKVFPPKI